MTRTPLTPQSTSGSAKRAESLARRALKAGGGLLGGGSGEGHVHEQTSPASTWNIVHDLTFVPSVTVVTSSGDVVGGAVRYMSPTEVRVEFSAAFAGQAYLS